MIMIKRREFLKCGYWSFSPVPQGVSPTEKGSEVVGGEGWKENHWKLVRWFIFRHWKYVEVCWFFYMNGCCRLDNPPSSSSSFNPLLLFLNPLLLWIWVEGESPSTYSFMLYLKLSRHHKKSCKFKNAKFPLPDSFLFHNFWKIGHQRQFLPPPSNKRHPSLSCPSWKIISDPVRLIIRGKNYIVNVV